MIGTGSDDSVRHSPSTPVLLVDRPHARPQWINLRSQPPTRHKSHLQKMLGCHRIPLRREHEINRLTAGIDRP
jgi:hypothetical protein